MISYHCINCGGLKRFPEKGHTATESLYTQVEFFVQLVHSNEVVAIEIALLLVLGLVHIYLLNPIYLPEQVLLVYGMAALVQLGQLHLVEATHLKYAEHLLLFVLKCEIVREELDLEGIREPLDHLEIVQVEKL